MSTASPAIKQQKPNKKKNAVPDAQANGSATGHDSTDILNILQAQTKMAAKSQWDYKLALAVITVLALVTRFYHISYPDEVVFDEVHFGKFASYYLQRTYFFDVHPPFGKLLFAFAGWFVGYDGSFLFENIGDSYITNKVPYVAYRTVPALLGSLTVSTVFLIMQESGYSLPACILAAGLVLFDNAHVAQTRLILLDATLVFAMALSVYCYVRFYKHRHVAFSRKWWKWLLLTGVSLSCVISTKYVGAFTFFSIGVPVMFDLWDLLDVNRKQGALALPDFGRHLGARVLGLIIFPYIIYLFWFQVHFAILSRSGPGDEFMSPAFQETLGDNIMTAQSVGVNYYDALTLRHKETKVYLHSHTERYPLRYDDGRVSSQGQQVTGYPHNDTNNQWQIQPINPADIGKANVVKNGDIVKLRHLVTDTFLLSHDVASPYHPTNQEFTTISVEEANGPRWNDSLFQIQVDKVANGVPIRTKASHFKLLHYPSRVAMWTHTTPLPEWAFKQAEINGNKNIQASSNIWYFEDIPSLPAGDARFHQEPRKIKTLSFLKKYFELQGLMFHHNNALTSSHPYASHPISWPFLLRGVSFWTKNDTREQIYFIGNPVGWWLVGSLLAVFAGIVGADQLSLRRGVDVLDRRTRSRLYNSTGFFFLTWAAHYIPFYIMGRQLFLHHYLPAHLASSLVAGALLEFICNVEPDIDGAALSDALNTKSNVSLTTDGASKSSTVKTETNNKKTPISERVAGQGQGAMYLSWAVMGGIMAVIVAGYVYYAPLTYGDRGLTIEEVQSRKWPMNYDLHFAK